MKFSLISRASISTNSRTKQHLIKPIQSLFQPLSIIISNVTNIYENLALEEWLYRNYDFSENDEKFLLIWRNRPTVVVGRHQNVWLETSIDYCRKNGIDIARRNSGGGTVYHDMNNLNISFLTSRKSYNRTRNLNFLKDVLSECFQIETEINPKKDLVLKNSGEKISGTASKLNSHNSYHHCTLLVDVDREKLRSSLRLQPINGVHSYATKSVPSPIINLNAVNKLVTMESLIEAITTNYGPHYDNNNNYTLVKHQINQIDLKSFGTVDDICQMFQSWEWIYGTTPKFTIEQEYSLDSKNFQIKLIIEKGVIKEIVFDETISKNVKEIIEKSFIKIRFEETNLREAFEKCKLFTNKCDNNNQQKQNIISIGLAIFSSLKKIIN